MTRLLVSAAVLVLALAVVGTTRGAERGRYVAANEALYDDLPTYPGSRVRSVTSTGYRENESQWSPVIGYGTLNLVELPEDARPDEIATFFERELQPEWTLVERLDGPVLNFRRADELVSINLESWRGHLLEVYVDHAR